MSQTLTFRSLTQACNTLGLEAPRHPLVSVFRHAELAAILNFQNVQIQSELYIIGMKDGVSGKMGYGRNSYDYTEGTMVFSAPDQVMNSNQITVAPGSIAWSLIFHPDLIRPFELGKHIHTYSYFSYAVTEALHLDKHEIQTLTELVHKIEVEYKQRIDRYSQKLIVANIELILDYCLRYYDRQFYLRNNQNQDVLTRFEGLLIAYYESERPINLGYPTVQYCGEELGLSPNYLSDLLKKETGKTAQEHIHLFLLEKAKTDLLKSQLSISEIAYTLGFGYPNHFSRFFKKKIGVNPREWRNEQRN
ncbi:MAG: helix-turn-helix domain-containing protein [Bacteroidota bacterium]